MQEDLEDLPLFTCSSLMVCVDASELLPVCIATIFALLGRDTVVDELFSLALIDISLFVADTLPKILLRSIELETRSSIQS